MNKINHQILCILLDYIYIYLLVLYLQQVDHLLHLASISIKHKMKKKYACILRDTESTKFILSICVL
jgi:hypothetical protein